jgi:hypothetical protein
LDGVYPIGQSSGQVNVAGMTWDLWIGYNGAMRVYSFIAPTVVKSFNADVRVFFKHLEQTQNFPASQQNLIGESRRVGDHGDRRLTDGSQSTKSGRRHSLAARRPSLSRSSRPTLTVN